MKKAITEICLIMFISNIAMADSAMAVPLKKEQIAPYDGVLLNKKAAAQVMTFLETAEEKCQLSLKELNESKDIECNANISFQKNRFERETNILNATIQSQLKQIETTEQKINLLEAENQKKWWNGFFTGTAFGIFSAGIIVGSIYLTK